MESPLQCQELKRIRNLVKTPLGQGPSKLDFQSIAEPHGNHRASLRCVSSTLVYGYPAAN